jgi:NCAIR mutase (PurE)-related protein
VKKDEVRRILRSLRDGRMTLDEAVQRLSLCYESLGFANVDVGRELRTGIAEALLCQGKTPQQILPIAESIYKRSGRLLATRASREVFDTVKKRVRGAHYHEVPGIIAANPYRKSARRTVAVVSAGTSDLPVAEEAAVTAEFLGNHVDRVYDVGVAGIHRLFGRLDRLRKAKVIIVVAGMEGALASVVGGLVAGPVIGVPTSVGYGASFGGVASLLTMLNSCAPGVTVVNIDNGFGAAVAAALVTARGR